MKISVTDEDINAAVRRSEVDCMVATAIGREIPEATQIKVNLRTIRFTLKDAEPAKDKRFVYLTPRMVSDYIVAFDAGRAPQPFDFVLKDPIIGILERPRRARRARPVERRPPMRRQARSFGERVLLANQME